MHKVISFCLWGNDPKYCIGAIHNAKLAQELYPDWVCRYYLGTCVSQDTITELIQYGNVEIFVANTPGDWRSMFWRFAPVYDESVDVMISRDTDSRLNIREKAAVDVWLLSDKGFHIMRDHPWHGTPILGGLWGIKKGVAPDFKELLETRTKEDRYDTDQAFLREDIYSLIVDDAIIHADFHSYEAHAQIFPTPRKNLEFVGEVFDEHDNNTPIHTKALENALKTSMKISVCVPCHVSHIERLPVLIRSLEEQTEQIDEVIVVINPAPFSDKAIKLVENIVTSLNINFIFSDQAKSAGAARNECASHASGTILSFIDADDISSPFRNESIKNFFIRHPDVGCFMHNLIFGEEVHPDKLEEFINDLSHQTIDFPFLEEFEYEKCEVHEKNATTLSVSSSLSICHGHPSVKRDAFNRSPYDTEPNPAEDSRFLRELAKHGVSIYYTPEKLIYYTTMFSTFKPKMRWS